MSKAFRTWAFFRRLIYGLGFGFFCSSIGTFVYFSYFYVPSSCMDSIQNGKETGIDCGGSCVAICVPDVIPPRVLWSKSFLITDEQYNVVAYVENPNLGEASPSLGYKFRLFSDNELVAERSGTTILPPGSVYPVFEGRVYVKPGTIVTRTEIDLDYSANWLPATFVADQFRPVDRVFKNADSSQPSIDAVIENTGLTVADDVEVVATVFNNRGEPVTVSQTFVDRIMPRSTRNIVFTWPSTIAKTITSCEIPTDVAVTIDLSGSMDNDGGTPPQPITDTLKAASQFVRNMKEKDQVAIVTFATKSNIRSNLSPVLGDVADQMLGLSIEPADQVGYTNTPAGLLNAKQELSSARHNDNARRVVVILSDGLPTAPGSAGANTAVREESIAVAKGMSDEGVKIYSIGLGNAVDRDFISAIASDPANAYMAPTTADLNRIYAEITASLCEEGPTRVDIIAKSKVNFAPLR